MTDREPDGPRTTGGPCDEELLAAYLAGELPPGRRESLEQHLLGCRACWQDLTRARAGRSAVELLREHAPEHLRPRLRAAVLAEAGGVPPEQRRSVRRRLTPRRPHLALLVAAAAVVTAVAVPTLHRDVPVADRVVAAAVEGYTAARLPGTAMPAERAPDLSGVGLREHAAGTGSLAGRDAAGYVYRDGAGHSVAVYVSLQPFDRPTDAVGLQAGTWMARSAGVTVVGMAADGHGMLVVSGSRDMAMSVTHELARA